MSINGLGAMLGLSPSQGVNATEAPSKPPSAADAAKDRAEAAKLRQRQDLDAVREKGIYAWAQEKKLEALKEKLREEMMKARGLDAAALAAMSPEDRAGALASLEEEIAKRVQEVMQESLTEEAKKAAKEGRPARPMIIDIAV